MDNYIMRTPQNNNSIYKANVFNSTGIEEDCPYCQMKRKFNIGSTGQQKCFQHSIKLNYQQQSDQGSKNSSKFEYIPPNQLVQVLEDVENALDYYWDNLRQVSGGNPNQIHKELQPVLTSVKRIQQKMGRFFFDSPMDVSEIKPVSAHVSQQRKFINSGSERFIKADFSNIFDPDQLSATQSIKQWVMHFHKILQLRQQPENIEPLSYEEQDLEMRIFKQSMQRKFLQFTDQMKVYERKIKDVLSRLIFYMEKSSDVSEKQIEEDILFIQGQNLTTESRQAQLERLLLTQASSMEHILRKNNFMR